MNTKPDISENTLIECAICLDEIPLSSAKAAETQDYIQYYCGINCYKEWQEKLEVLENNKGNVI